MKIKQYLEFYSKIKELKTINCNNFDKKDLKSYLKNNRKFKIIYSCKMQIQSIN